MSLYEHLFATLRSTGFVTSSQADSLSHAVEGQIHTREQALNSHISALQTRLDGLKALIETANEGTDAMDAVEYNARCVAAFEALCAPGLFEPIAKPELMPATPPEIEPIRIVIDIIDGTKITCHPEMPVEVICVHRSYTDTSDEPEVGAISKVECSKYPGEALDRYFAEFEANA